MIKNFLNKKIIIIYSLLFIYFISLILTETYTFKFFLIPNINIFEKFKLSYLILGCIFLSTFLIFRFKKKFHVELLVLLIFFIIQFFSDLQSTKIIIDQYKNGFILPIICILLIIFIQNANNENKELHKKIFYLFYLIIAFFFLLIIFFFLLNTSLKFFSSENMFYGFAEDFYFINNKDTFKQNLNTIKLFNFTLPLPNGNGASRMLIIFYLYLILKFFLLNLTRIKYIFLSIFIILLNSFIFLLQSKLSCFFMLITTPIIIYIFHRINMKFFIYFFIFVIFPIINSYFIYQLKIKKINSGHEIEKKINYEKFNDLKLNNKNLNGINFTNYDLQIKSFDSYLSTRRIFSPLLIYFNTFNKKDLSFKNIIYSQHLTEFSSGRNYIAVEILQNFKNSIFIGHGVKSDRILLNGNSASNAILYSLLSTGIIGFSILIFFYYLLFLNLKKIFQEIYVSNYKNLFYFIMLLFIILRSFVENSFTTWNFDLLIILLIIHKVNLKKFIIS
jgi:hypothetical protein